MDGLSGRTLYTGAGDCVRQTYRNEGVRGFFRGMPSTLIRSFPVNAATFTVVTLILRWASESSPTASSSSSSSEQQQQQQPLQQPQQQQHQQQQHKNEMERLRVDANDQLVP